MQIFFPVKSSLFELRKLKKHCSYSVRHTAEKLPVYIRYIEQEYGVLIMEKTKRKNLNRQNRKRFADDYFNEETA